MNMKKKFINLEFNSEEAKRLEKATIRTGLLTSQFARMAILKEVEATNQN